jgi:hypothetical protein
MEIQTRMKYAIVIIVFMFGLLMCSAANAMCKSGPIAKYEVWRQDTLNRNQTIRLFERVLENEEAQAFVSAYNYTPPKSDKSAEKIAVWYAPGSPWMLVVWIADDCIDGTEKIPVPVMNSLLRGVPHVPLKET